MDISHYVLKTKFLGPFVRSALWVHGCCFCCKGCLAREMNERSPIQIATEELSKRFADVKNTEGITISGGEPFLQAKALSEMIDQIRGRRDYGVIVYTGFTLEELQEKNDYWISSLLDQADLLIDGRYREDLDDGRPLRGSSNQKLHFFTERYQGVLERKELEEGKRNIEIKVESDQLIMIGIPSREGLQVWNNLKNRAAGGL